MNKIRILATMVLAACGADAAAAVALDKDGLGQGLLFPYYTVEDGQATVVAVQNTSSRAKALKVRIIESHAGRDALLFNVYLAPRATWSAAIVADANGSGGALHFNPGTCTVPVGPDVAEPFRNNAYVGSRDDEGTSDLSRTREGQIEIIEMGALNDTLGAIASNPTDSNCQNLLQRWVEGGVWASVDANDGLLVPTGGLRGDAIIIDVEAGTAFGYPALGFTGLASAPRHTRPDSSTPRLYNIQVPSGEDITVNLIDADGEPVSLTYPVARGMDAISALLSRTSVSSSYNISPALAARTDWIVGFPLRYAYIDDAPGGILPSGTPPVAPFTSRTCESASLSRFDGGGRASEVGSEDIELCGQAPTLRFRLGGADDSSLVASDESVLIPAQQSGTAVLDVGSSEGEARLGRPDVSGRCVRGLPIWVLSVTGYDNDNAQPGRVATYPEARVGSGTYEIVDC